MKTLTLKEAAALLKMHPQSLRTKVINGLVPGAKVGKSWVFIEEDLVQYIRSSYIKSGRTLVSIGGEQCFTNDRIVNTGGVDSPHQMERKYAELLKLPIAKRPKSMK